MCLQVGLPSHMMQQLVCRLGIGLAQLLDTSIVVHCSTPPPPPSHRTCLHLRVCSVNAFERLHPVP